MLNIKNKKKVKYEHKNGIKSNYKYHFLSFENVNKKPIILKTDMKFIFFQKILNIYLKKLETKLKTELPPVLSSMIIDFCLKLDDKIIIAIFENFDIKIDIRNVQGTNKWIGIVSKSFLEKGEYIFNTLPSITRYESLSNLNLINNYKLKYPIKYSRKNKLEFLYGSNKTKEIVQININENNGNLIYLSYQNIYNSIYESHLILALLNDKLQICNFENNVLVFPFSNSIKYACFEERDIIIQLFNKKNKYNLVFLYDFIFKFQPNPKFNTFKNLNLLKYNFEENDTNSEIEFDIKSYHLETGNCNCICIIL